jgi:hypothetical protein
MLRGADAQWVDESRPIGTAHVWPLVDFPSIAVARRSNSFASAMILIDYHLIGKIPRDMAKPLRLGTQPGWVIHSRGVDSINSRVCSSWTLL